MVSILLSGGHYEMTTSGESPSDAGRRRRHWSDEDQARIVAACEAPGSSVSMVARRHDLNINMLFSRP
jgi:transposase-like protein